jgi:ABC-type glutathione transport system ATPase component
MTLEAHGKESSLFLCIRGLTKRYWVKTAAWRRRTSVIAVDGVSFEMPTGKTFAVIGGSGSGKSTLARCVACLEKPDAGEIWFEGRNIAACNSRELLAYRMRIQMIFQDPVTAMNSRMSAGEIIEEPLLIQRRGTRNERRLRVAELMREVGLLPDWMDRRITEFSGGQRQRLAIARALSLDPRLLILDEALSGLDLSTQEQIASLLRDLQVAHSLTYLLISHDLKLVSRMADDVAVMAVGKIVEQGSLRQIVGAPTHPETKALLQAATGFQSAYAAACGAPR